MLKIDYFENSSVKQSQSKGKIGQFGWVNARQLCRNLFAFALNHAEYIFFIDY